MPRSDPASSAWQSRRPASPSPCQPCPYSARRRPWPRPPPSSVNCGWRRLGDKGEGAVGVDRDDNRNHQARHVRSRRARVELLAEFHDVHLRLAQSWADRRRGSRLRGNDLQFHLRLYFLNWRHRSIPFKIAGAPRLDLETWVLAPLYAIFSTLLNSNSTGVERPKIVTMTFRVSRSSFTSSTTPLKLANGPSVIFTDSFFSNFTFMRGLSFDTSDRKIIELISSSVSATGFSPVPKKPVTRGVFLTRCQISLSRSISTST